MNYSYINAQFKNNKYDPDSLERQILDQLPNDGYDCINGSETGCSVCFSIELNALQKSKLDSIVTNHTGDPDTIISNDTTTVIVPKSQDLPISYTGGLLVAQTYTGIEENYIAKSRKHKAPAGELTFFDVQITSEIRVKGGEYIIINFENIGTDDYLEFSVIDKDDVLGLFSTYGLLVGTDILELKKFVRTEYISAKQKVIENGYQAAYVYPGLYIRTSYQSTGTVDVNFICKWFYYE